MIKNKIFRLWKDNRTSINFLAIGFLALSLIGTLPYLNLLFTPLFNLGVTFVLFTIIFKVKGESIFKLLIFLFPITALTQIIGLEIVTEDIGNLVYFLIFYGLIRMSFSLKGEE